MIFLNLAETLLILFYKDAFPNIKTKGHIVLFKART